MDGIRGRSRSGAERAFAREILRELIEIPTTADNGATPRAAQAMADRLVAAGFRARTSAFSIESARRQSCCPLRGTEPAGRPSCSWRISRRPCAARGLVRRSLGAAGARNGWFYGRGTTDNKAGAAMLIANFVRLKREGWRPRSDLIIALTGDEEPRRPSIRAAEGASAAR